jgi:hypothetical protein
MGAELFLQVRFRLLARSSFLVPIVGNGRAASRGKTIDVAMIESAFMCRMSLVVRSERWRRPA